MGKEKLEHIANDPQQGFCSPLGRVERHLIPQPGHSVYEVNGTGYKEVRVCGRVYRVHPVMGIGASEDGQFLNVVTWRRVVPKLRHNYAEIRQRSREYGCRSMGAKRMMIELWKPEWADEEVIAHIDGDETNFAIANLCIGSKHRLVREQQEYLDERYGEASDDEFRRTEDCRIRVSRKGEVMRNGRILDLEGMARSKNSVVVCYNGRMRRLSHIVYETWTGRSLKDDEIVVHKDGDKMNYDVDNLTVVDKYEYFEETKRFRLTDEGIAREVERKVKETRLMLYWFRTGEWDMYTEYLMNEVYPHLVEKGSKYVGKGVAERGASEVIGNIYMLIGKNRVINDYWHLAERMLGRFVKRYNTETDEMRLTEMKGGVNRELFRKIAKKYGVDIIV